MKKAFNHKDLSAGIFGVCSGITWDTKDHRHFCGVVIMIYIVFVLRMLFLCHANKRIIYLVIL